jgi:hypothetical protein
MAREKLFIVKPPNTQKVVRTERSLMEPGSNQIFATPAENFSKRLPGVGQMGFRLFMGAQSMMLGLGGKVVRLK